MSIARPTIRDLQRHYPAPGDGFDRTTLFQSIGWDRELSHPAFQDTCAIRVSIGLIGCGVPVIGRMKILKGPFKDRWIQPGQRDLSYFLRNYWGQPEKYKPRDVKSKLMGRCGIISHFNINPESPIAQGHIDVLAPDAKDALRCENRCWWGAADSWFWELPR